MADKQEGFLGTALTWTVCELRCQVTALKIGYADIICTGHGDQGRAFHPFSAPYWSYPYKLATQ